MTVLHQGLCFIDTQDREKKVFVIYFCSTPFPSLLHSLFLSGGSMYLRGDHQSNRLYYYFSTKCFDFQPTQKIKPPSSSLPSPSFPPTYLFFSLLYFLTHFLTSVLYFFPKSFVLPLSFLRLFHLKKCSPAKMEGFHCVFLIDKLDNTRLDAL